MPGRDHLCFSLDCLWLHGAMTRVTSQGLDFQVRGHLEAISSKLSWMSRCFKGPVLNNGFFPHVFKFFAISLRNCICIPVSKVVVVVVVMVDGKEPYLGHLPSYKGTQGI